jgi:hypothetical protein
MKRRNILKAVTLLSTALVVTLVLGAGKTQRYRVPQDMPLPLYATGLSHTGTEADDWVVTAFYYPSDTIPADYDLFNEPVFDPPVGVVTPLVEGFLVFHDDDPAPVPQVMRNAPGAKVEIWFTPAQNFANGVGPYPPFTWTVNSMKAEGSIVGYADSFSQTWVAGRPINNNTVVAAGVLQDGRTFWVKTTYAIGGPEGVAPVPYCMVHFGP